MRRYAQVATACAMLFCRCGSLQPPPTPPGPSPLFNLMPTTTDGNGYPVNPTWSGQHGDECVDPYVCNFDKIGGRCNTQALPGSGTDTAQRAFWRALFSGNLFHYTCEKAAKEGHYPGHVNVGVATYEGALGWDGISIDADYDLRLYPHAGGVTDSNPEFIHIEFDSDETLNQFDSMPAWWAAFRDAALKFPDDGSFDSLIGARPYAVMTGLLGFDCEHDCHSELHPVYVLAVRQPPTNGVERWSILARNWGTEGWCSSLNHVIGSPVRVRLPYGNVTSVQSDTAGTNFRIYYSRGVGFFDRLGLFFSRNEGVAQYYPPAAVPGGVEITFDLPTWRTRGVVVGEVAFSLNPDAVPPSVSPRSCTVLTQKTVKPPPPFVGDEERAHNLASRIHAGAISLARPLSVGTGKEVAEVTAMHLTTLGPRMDVAPIPEAVPKTAPSTAATSTKSELLIDRRLQQICAAALTQHLTDDPDYVALCQARK